MKIGTELESLKIAVRAAVIAVLIEIFENSEESEILELISEYAKDFLEEQLAEGEIIN